MSFAGEDYEVRADQPFVIGRVGDLAIPDNQHLHRRFLEIRREHDLWWLCNLGNHLVANLIDNSSGLRAWLQPGSRLPIVFASSTVTFIAGPTAYELEIASDVPEFTLDAVGEMEEATITVGRLRLTDDQRLLLLALCEQTLLNPAQGIQVQSSAEAAARLGWEFTKFNRKLDNVCSRLAGSGVRGLHGSAGNLASGRKTRLIEYVLSTGLVTSSELLLLPSPPNPGL